MAILMVIETRAIATIPKATTTTSPIFCMALVQRSTLFTTSSGNFISFLPELSLLISGRLWSRPEISKDSSGKKEIKFPEDVVNKVLRWTSAIQNIGLVVVVAFGIVAIALVSITIRMAIYSRRKEIGIMKLVGATNWFIRWPFIMEGIIEGFFGAIVGIIVTLVLHVWP